MTSETRTAAIQRIAEIDARIDEVGIGSRSEGIAEVIALFKERNALVEALGTDAH